jgi:hypothetical protein
VKHENVSKEPEMATQYTVSRFPKGTRPALFSFALPFLCAGPLEQASLRFDGLLCALASELLKYLPSILVEAGQRLGSYALDHLQLFGCVESLVSFYSVVRLLAGVVSH